MTTTRYLDLSDVIHVAELYADGTWKDAYYRHTRSCERGCQELGYAMRRISEMYPDPEVVTRAFLGINDNPPRVLVFSFTDDGLESS